MIHPPRPLPLIHHLPSAMAIAGVALLSACTQGGPTVEATEREGPAYMISHGLDNPGSALVELILPAAGEERRLVSRAAALQAQIQVEGVSCDGAPAERAGDEWILPPSCRTAHWRIPFETAEPGSVSPSQQRSLVINDAWMLVSGPASILRLSGYENESLPVHISGPHGSGARTLPPMSAPPAFFAMGEAPSVHYGERSPRLIYVADDLQALPALIDPALHYQAIEYMRAIIGADLARDADALTVVWFGADRERFEVSGAAGYDTLIANYILPGETPSAFEAAAPFILVLHEQFHQLETGANPHWVSESLANYYALKAARLILPDHEGVEQAWAMFIDPEAPVEPGLLELQRRIDEDGDYSGYMQFYSAGAAFWASLDEALSQATGGERSLDDILPVILAGEYEPGAGLPGSVMQALSPIPSETLERILARYL